MPLLPWESEKGKNALKIHFGKKDILTIPNLMSFFRMS